MSTLPRVFVDATAIPSDRGGVGRYLAQLLPALVAAGLPLVVAVQPRDADWLRGLLGGGAEVVAVPSARRRLIRMVWEQLGLPRAVRRHGATVLFSPHYTMPLLTRVPVVVTMHDATFFSHPQFHHRLKRAFFRAWTRISARRAAVVVVPSQATADELHVRLRHAPHAMHAVHHGVDLELFGPPSPVERTRAAELVGAPDWVAYLGTVEPRKNVGALVRAFELLREDAAIAADRPELHLAIAGGRGWDEAAEQAVLVSPARESIRRLGFVPDGDLRGLLGGALAVAYPSTIEGFGLPVIEAMACGAPVVTTDSPALREVGGDAARYAEPIPDALAVALRELILDPAEREARSRAGRSRAAGFSWSASAAGHIAAFEEAAA